MEAMLAECKAKLINAALSLDEARAYLEAQATTDENREETKELIDALQHHPKLAQRAQERSDEFTNVLLEMDAEDEVSDEDRSESEASESSAED